jgi:hypothetical protein
VCCGVDPIPAPMVLPWDSSVCASHVKMAICSEDVREAIEAPGRTAMRGHQLRVNAARPAQGAPLRSLIRTLDKRLRLCGLAVACDQS